MKKWIVLILIAVVAVVGWWYWHRAGSTGPAFRTAPVTRGDLLATIGATGTVEPEDVVDVGSQIAGLIEYFGKDPHRPGKTIDYGSQVDEGTVLAHIDESLYAADVANAKAMVAQGIANVQKAQADLDQDKAKLQQAANDWKRAQEAGIHAGLSQSDIDSYQANYEVAVATVADGQAAIALAQTGVAQAQAGLDRANKNLSYCTITSPVDGTIIDRRVNIGQTVVAALDAPSLFLIAKDLKKMQVWASVNEADIGNIHPGQTANFTVDAFPNRTFAGTVNKVRYNASMTQNVVTYTVEVNTDNSDGTLLPYLTANVQFTLDKRTNVLKVPNSALRWTPLDPQVAPDARTSDAMTQPHDTPGHDHGTLWVVDGQFVRPIPVKTGLSDGVETQVAGDGLQEGTQVVIGDANLDEAGGGANPFVPQFGNRRR